MDRFRRPSRASSLEMPNGSGGSQTPRLAICWMLAGAGIRRPRRYATTSRRGTGCADSRAAVVMRPQPIKTTSSPGSRAVQLVPGIWDRSAGVITDSRLRVPGRSCNRAQMVHVPGSPPTGRFTCCRLTESSLRRSHHPLRRNNTGNRNHRRRQVPTLRPFDRLLATATARVRALRSRRSIAQFGLSQTRPHQCNQAEHVGEHRDGNRRSQPSPNRIFGQRPAHVDR